MKIEIESGDRQLAFAILFIVTAITIGAVTAYNAVPGAGIPAAMGHSVDEMDWANPIQSNISVTGQIDATGDICTAAGSAPCLSTRGVGDITDVDGGDGLTELNCDSGNCELDVDTGIAATTGLEIVGDQVRLMDNGCLATEILKRNAANTGWECVADSTGAGGNTLDEAYDEGGAGLGRTINATNGQVEIQGAGGLLVNADICTNAGTGPCLSTRGVGDITDVDGGDGLTEVSCDSGNCELDVDTGIAATTGLEIVSDEVRLMDNGCAAGEILKRNATNTGWGCVADNTGAGGGSVFGGNWGGMYAVCCNGACPAPNPATGGCSCPAGYATSNISFIIALTACGGPPCGSSGSIRYCFQ